MSLSAAPMQDFFFEVTDSGVFTTTNVTHYQLTVNRVNQNDGTNDYVSSKFLTADSDGKLPKTQVSINVPSGTTDLNAYFDASFIIVATSFDAQQNDLDTFDILAKYTLPPQSDTIGNINLRTEESRLFIDGELLDASFDITGLQYMIQIDGPSASGYKSRVVYKAHDGSGNLVFDSSSDNLTPALLNNKRYDVAVIAFNPTGSSGVIEDTFNILVSENANAPGLAQDAIDRKNTASSEGIITIEISGNHVSNDSDKKYRIKVAETDTSSNILNNYTSVVDASGEEKITHTISGLTANVSYTIFVEAQNSTGIYSDPTTIPIIPEALPSGLRILDIRKGLFADEEAPSGKLLVLLDTDNFKENGVDVSLNYRVLKVSDVNQTAQQIANSLEGADKVPVSMSAPFYDYSGNYITNGFFINDLSNNVHHLVAVDALNDSDGFTDLSASWIGVNNTIQVTATNAPKPITRPDAPTIETVHPEASEKSTLNSGEIKVTIKLPAGNLDVSDNIPEYSSYRIFIEDASGRDVAGKTTGDVALDFTDYLVLGDRFQHADTGETIVLTTDDADGSFGSTKHSSYSDDASWSIVATNVEWFDANGNNKMGGDASFSAVFSGLTDGESYFAKAQVKLDTLESSIVAKDDANVPSSKPSLDSNLGNKVAGIFDVTSGTILDPSTNEVSFTQEGLEELLVGSTSGGYDISSVLVAFVNTITNVQGVDISTIHKEYMVNTDGSVDASYESTALTGDKTYSVHVVPQNGIYNDVSFATFTDLSNVSGSVILGSIKLDSKILDVSGGLTPNIRVDGTKIKIDGVLESGNGDITVLKRIEGSLTAKPYQWNPNASPSLEEMNDASFNVVTNFTLTEGNGITNGVFTKEFDVASDKYGWKHDVLLNVISRPSDDVLGTVEYSASDKAVNNLVAGTKPTIYLDDVSNVTIIPNSFATTVTMIDLSGHELDTIDPIPGGDAANDTDAMNVWVNTFYDVSNDLVHLDPAESNYKAVSGVKNTFQIDEDVNLQTSAHNEKGRTTLFSEKKFTVNIVSGPANLVTSANDGKFVINATTAGNITFKLDIA